MPTHKFFLKKKTSYVSLSRRWIKVQTYKINYELFKDFSNHLVYLDYDCCLNKDVFSFQPNWSPTT